MKREQLTAEPWLQILIFHKLCPLRSNALNASNGHVTILYVSLMSLSFLLVLSHSLLHRLFCGRDLWFCSIDSRATEREHVQCVHIQQQILHCCVHNLFCTLYKSDLWKQKNGKNDDNNRNQYVVNRVEKYASPPKNVWH